MPVPRQLFVHQALHCRFDQPDSTACPSAWHYNPNPRTLTPSTPPFSRLSMRFHVFFSRLRTAQTELDVHQDVTSNNARLELALSKLCRLPESESNGSVHSVAAERVQRVAEFLQLLRRSEPNDGKQWRSRARTYIILHNLNCIGFMEDFIRDGKTDIWLPYDEGTLPEYVQPQRVRTQFLEVQRYLLTSARDLEGLSTDESLDRVLPHIHLAGSADQHFIKIARLGQGTFGCVEKVASCLSERVYARKSVMRRRKSTIAQKVIVRELESLKKLSHRHLVKLRGSYTDPQYIAYLMLPVADCNLHDFLTKPGGLNSGERHVVRAFFGCLASAVNYLYRSRIRHRDLKSGNILVHKGSVYISDFGSAYRWASNGNHGSMTQDHHVLATAFYMAPEVAKKGPRSSSSDMWSLGIIYMEMTTVLVGRTIGQLRGILSDNAKTSMEPYIWANPKVVTTWVESLQKYNKGPRHDNEPLEWIRDLLNPNPESRPRSGVLMQDIHDTQSFNIFCCIACQPDLRERRYTDNDIRSTCDEPSDNTTDIMECVASLLSEDEPQPTVISSRTRSTIRTWLEDTKHGRQMPGSFDVADDSGPEELSDVFHDDTPAQSDLQSDDATSPLTPCEDFSSDDLSMTTGQATPSTYSTPPEFADHYTRDTGLGFCVIESPSSSDDGYRVDSDSSGSDTDSDVTIILQPTDETADMTDYRGVQQSGLALPQFTGEEDRIIQALNDLPEEQDDTNNIVHSSNGETDIVEENNDHTVHSGASQTEGRVDSLMGQAKLRHKQNSGKKLSSKRANPSTKNSVRDEETGQSSKGLRNILTGQSMDDQQTEDVLGSPPVVPRCQNMESALPEMLIYVTPEPVCPVETSDSSVSEGSDTQMGQPGTKTKKKKSAQVKFTLDSSTTQSPSLPKGSTLDHGISPDDYIQSTWESASTVATSIMSFQTRRILKSISLNRWLDHDHNLMEVFCHRGKAAAVRVLLETGCNPGKFGPKAVRRPGPIRIAIQGASPRHNKCVQALIEKGVDVNVEIRSTGKTPLHLAIENPYFKGYEHLICALIRAGANTNKADHRGDYPISKILQHKESGPLEDHLRKALALLLQDTLTDVNVTLPGTLNTPLHLAVRRQDPFAAAMLLYKKANVNAKNASGTTPLLVAANQFHAPMTKVQMDLLILLLRCDGIRINEKAGVKEQTALHYAIHAGVPWAVGKLLEHGADPTCKDSEGHDARALSRLCAERMSAEDRESILIHLENALARTGSAEGRV